MAVPEDKQKWAPINPREALKKKLFRKVDKDEDGFLNKAEMRELAGLVGFEGSAQEWEQEYQKLCLEVNVKPEEGVPQAVVLNLLDDESDTGCYCNDEEIRTLLGDESATDTTASTTATVGPTTGTSKASKSAAEGASSDGDSQIYFAGASFDASEDKLHRLFKKHGQVKDFILFRLPDGRSRGMGIVQYSTPAEAAKAIDELHSKEVNGISAAKLTVKLHKDTKTERLIENTKTTTQKEPKGKPSESKEKTGKSKPTSTSKLEHGTTLFFSGFPFGMNLKKISQTFEECGTVVQFWPFTKEGKSRGMGIVEFQSVKEAKYAVKMLHGQDMDGRKLVVQADLYDAGSAPVDSSYEEWSDWRGWEAPHESYSTPIGASAPIGSHPQDWPTWGTGGGKPSKSKAKHADADYWGSNRVFFSGADSTLPGHVVQRYFQEYGEIRSFSLFRHPNGRSRGMGVVTFVLSDSAHEVLEHGIEINGWPLFVQEDVSQFAEESYETEETSWDRKVHVSSGTKSRPYRQNEYEDQWYESYGESKLNVAPEKSVFFANVPYETTEGYLRKTFEKVGAIRNFKLFTTKDGRSRGMGVVEFEHRASVSKAYNTLHDSIVSGRQMIVDIFRS